MKRHPNIKFSPKKVKITKEENKITPLNTFVDRFLHWDLIIVSFVSGVLLMTIGLVSFRTWNTYQKKLYYEKMQTELVHKKNYWREIVLNYPGYKDAQLEYAKLLFKLGEDAESKKYLIDVLSIDPNSKQARKLLEELER